MARVSTYLNFPRNTQESFDFYKSIFGGELGDGGVAHLSNMPDTKGLSTFAAVSINFWYSSFSSAQKNSNPKEMDKQ
jgi:PhnB protein